MVARRNVGVTDTPTKNKMNIYLLNIPFAVLGVAIAVVPLIIGVRHNSRTQLDVVALEPITALQPVHPHEELPVAA
jgi:hypothetical protein